MKKLLTLSLVLALCSNVMFTGCATDNAPQRTITEELKDDQTFTDAVINTVDLFATAQENNWMQHTETIQEMMRKSNDVGLSSAEEAQLTELLGMDRLAFVEQNDRFGTSMNNLLEKYPTLNDMAASERQALFASVIADNPDLAAYMAELSAHGRMCFLQDLCNLVVDLAVIIGGPILCDIIAGAIPVIGPLLCNIVLDLGEDILVGICNGLPC